MNIVRYLKIHIVCSHSRKRGKRYTQGVYTSSSVLKTLTYQAPDDKFGLVLYMSIIMKIQDLYTFS